jgi:asparagine synthetase A
MMIVVHRTMRVEDDDVTHNYRVDEVDWRRVGDNKRPNMRLC